MRLRSLFLGILSAGLLASGCGSSSDGLSAVSNGPSAASGQPREPQAPPLAARAFDDRLLAAEQTEAFNLLDNDDHNGGKVIRFVATTDQRAQSSSGGLDGAVVGSAGGQATVDEDGNVTYTPPSGTDPYRETFTYTIKNDTGESTATLMAQRTETVYVDNGAAPNGNGSSGKPFDNLQAALDFLGERPGQIRVKARDNSVTGLILPLVRLRSGQAILGQNGDKTPTPVRARFELDSTDCVVSDLHIVSNGGGDPAIRVSGNTVALATTPKVVLRNLLVDGNDGDGIALEQATTTEITNVALLVLNQKSGRGALVIASPLGSVQVSKLRIETNPLAGIVVDSPTALPVLGGDWSVEVLDTQMQSVQNPVTVGAKGGALSMRFSGASFQDVRGPIFAGAIGGNARVDCRFDGIDLKGIGADTTVMDWSYHDTATGTVRVGKTAADISPSSASNTLKFATHDQAQASFLSQGSRFYPNKNQVEIDAWDQSNLKFRLQDYIWEESGRTSVGGYPLSLAAHDLASIDSLILDQTYSSDYTWVGVHVAYSCDVNSLQRVEGLQDGLSYFDPDDNIETLNPYATFSFSGWQRVNGLVRHFDSVSTSVLVGLPGGPQFSYQAVDIGSTGIPTF